jgi:protein-L-isoaspartate(D-aspartate) O-methyltransferase
MNVEQARFNMIEQQIRPWDVLDPSVLELLHVVHREDFVPEAHRHQAFVDIELPLTATRRMLAPKVEARLLQELKVQRHEKVLEIGSAATRPSASSRWRPTPAWPPRLRPTLGAPACSMSAC